jgi:dihydrofolate reductase
MPLNMKAISAMSRNRVIGRDNQLPWNLPDDLRFFRETTKGGRLIMGRKTFASIGRPLPGRETVVLSRDPSIDLPGVCIVRDLEALDALQTDRPVWVCGGAEIYRQLLPACSELLLTVLHENYDGDSFFPPFEDLFETPEILRQTNAFEIRRYRRKAIL